MNELIKIEKQVIGTEEINAVDARELWVFLEIPTQFSKWFSRRIGEYNFTQGVDFITIVNSDFSPPRKEYTISIDMAKELSMVERNKKGKEARKYFIECEKKLRSLVDFNNPAEAARAWALEYEKKQALQIELKAAQPSIDFVNIVTAKSESIRIGDFAKILSDVSGVIIFPNKLFQYFRDNNYLMIGRDSREKNKPYQIHIEKGLFEYKYENPQPNIIVGVTYITGAGQFKFKDDVIAHFS